MGEYESQQGQKEKSKSKEKEEKERRMSSVGCEGTTAKRYKPGTEFTPILQKGTNLLVAKIQTL